jgi:uncharacterized protein with GYD domain
MARYLIQASYTPEGLKGLLKEGGTGRRKAVESMVKALEGRLEAFYFAFGDTDVYTIVDLPDNVTASAVALAVNQAGGARVRTTVLVTPEEIDAAVKKSVPYRAPGR